ncbi:PTS fructose transporter subunit IIABC [Lacticigenium naphthae]|uniref:PTS fructose transporter subunit IIABC n=1 Tax=Lacticigenium naphthae TaxID=515351 RepID=UPI0004031EA2|nr:PTS fructose transporter subunit IIABC [Lacticigenium naphthae]
MENKKQTKIVALTACPVGIAHTYMAAENLQKAGDKMGVDIKVETHGSIGVENALTDEEISQADGVIIASDTVLDKSRFNGKPLVVVGVQEGIRNPEELIQRVIDGDAEVYGDVADAQQVKKSSSKDSGNLVYRHLMNGVSYMVPFVVVGGLLIAIALTLGGEPGPAGIVVPEGTIWSSILAIGGAAMSFMIPILSAFIAYSIADRPGLVPGMIGGLIAADGSFYGSEAGAGFIGGIITGFLAGYIALWLKKVKVPQMMRSVMPIIFIPILSSLAVGLLFILVIGQPVATFFLFLTEWLAGMQGGSSIVLAMILGAMIAVDMGGPFNKVAFLFGAGMIAEGNYEIMGPIAVAICVPPLGLGLASFLLKDKFTIGERETGKASFTMGLFGITEGAIPFATQDPLRVIPSIVIGSVAGAVTASIGNVGDRVAHGGPIVAVLGAVDNVLMFFVATLVGVAVTVLMLKLLKKNIEEPEMAVATAGGAVVPTSERATATSDPTEATAAPNVAKPVNQLTDILTKDLIELDLKSSTKEDVMDELIAKLARYGGVTSEREFKKAILAREGESTTGIGMNIAIPHGKSSAVTEPCVVFGRKNDGVDWDSLDGTDAKLIFMIAVPEDNKDNAHLKILQMLSRKLMDDQFRNDLMKSETKEEAYRLLQAVS